MNLRIQCEERVLDVEVADTGVGQQVKIDGNPVPCDCRRLPNGNYSVIIAGRVYDFATEYSDGKCALTCREGSWVMDVADTRRFALDHGAAAGAAGIQRLTAEMPGKVIRVLVGIGDPVEAEQGLLVVEAMKMQNEIRAPKAGTVREIGVSPGATVSTRDFLISIE